MLTFRLSVTPTGTKVVQVFGRSEADLKTMRNIREAAGAAFLVDRNSFKTIQDAERIAAQATEATGELYVAADSGAHVSPRYDVIKAPKVGDEVSYAFNGDSYPCGKITKISDSLRRVVAEEENGAKHVFYRRRNSGAWIKDQTWHLTPGHVYTQNPSF